MSTRVINPILSFILPLGALLLIQAQAFGQASTEYKGVSRDPFMKYKPAKNVNLPTNRPGPVTPPTIQERIDRYKTQKIQAMNLQQPAPKPTTALLLREVEVTGIFRTPRGYAAMVEAKPIKLSYVIYPGESFYDGQLVAVEESRLVFRKEVKWTDGKRTTEVETKTLRRSGSTSNSMALSAPRVQEGATEGQAEKTEVTQPAPVTVP
jgi:hypothetical protein